MIDFPLLLLSVPLSLAALLPAYWAWKFVNFYRKHTRVPAPAIASSPRVAVILCLRGADPSLEACLRGLLHQNYHRYQIHIVVDHLEDPACEQVQQVLARYQPLPVPVEVQTLEKPCSTCSLKVCAQLQVVSRLSPAIEVVALIDADSIPAPDWLRALVEPMNDPRIGASTGIRWFAPMDGGWGSLMRSVYNAGSFPQMFTFDHPWGGSLALRAEVFHQSTYKKRLCHALCEDSASFGALRELGLRLAFVPAATHINFESIGFAANLRFMQRQLLCLRLDHAGWPKWFALNMLNSLAVLGLGGMALAGLCLQRWDWVAAGGGGIALAYSAMLAALFSAELAIRRNFRLRGLEATPPVWSWKMFPASLLTQLVSMVFLMRTLFLRHVDWRGIRYTIKGPGKIRLQKYEPYQPPHSTTMVDQSVT